MKQPEFEVHPGRWLGCRQEVYTLDAGFASVGAHLVAHDPHRLPCPVRFATFSSLTPKLRRRWRRASGWRRPRVSCKRNVPVAFALGASLRLMPRFTSRPMPKGDMDLILFHLEIVALGTGVVGLYALRPRLGLAPIYTGLGLLLAFMMVAGHLKLFVQVVGGGQAYYPSLFFLPLVLVGIALVYTLEGTGEARRLLVAIVVAKALINVLKWLMSLRLHQGDVDLTLYGRDRWAHVVLSSTVNSTLAILLAACAIIVVYQAMLNVWSRMPVFVALTTALLAAMLTDAVAFAGLSGWLERLDAHVVGKLTAGLAASLPAAVFISLRLNREPAEVRRGVLERGTFEIVNLRRQLSEVSADLSRRKEEFAHLKSVFGRYVVPDVVDELLRDASQLRLGGELREVTVLLSDIRGYSTLSERLSPTETITLLNRYFGAMSTVIDAQRGTIIEFEGDAILAVFGAPIHQPDHADRALRAALAMRQALAELNAQWHGDGTAAHWQALGMADLGARVGIHSGEVVVGNIGSETRTKYAVIGDTVNLTAAVEQLNKGLATTLLLTEATRALLQSPRDDLHSMGEHLIGGRAEPLEVYTVATLVDAASSPAQLTGAVESSE